MKTILVDAIYTFVLEDKEIFKEMYNLLEKFPNKKIILTGATGKRFTDFGLDKMPYDVFTLGQDPPKSDSKYYETLLKRYDLSKDDVIYFEHNEEAARSAQSVGIKTYHYDSKKKDLAALTNFLNENL